MGFRFRKGVKLAPGVRLNLSKSGTSFSFGGRGATVNVRGRRVRTTLGIPGTGLSYVSQKTFGSKARNRVNTHAPDWDQLPVPPMQKTGPGAGAILAILVVVCAGLAVLLANGWLGGALTSVAAFAIVIWLLKR
jgi:hypothetical protein